MDSPGQFGLDDDIDFDGDVNQYGEFYSFSILCVRRVFLLMFVCVEVELHKYLRLRLHSRSPTSKNSKANPNANSNTPGDNIIGDDDGLFDEEAPGMAGDVDMSDMASAIQGSGIQGSRVPNGTPGLWGQTTPGAQSIGMSPRVQGNNMRAVPRQSGRKSEFMNDYLCLCLSISMLCFIITTTTAACSQLESSCML